MGGAPTGLSARFSKQSESALPPGSTAKSAHGVRNRGVRSISLTLRTEHSEPRCAYCHSPERLLGLPLEVDHIIPTTAGGRTLLANLCLCCRSCNGHKWQQTHAQDPQTGRRVRLYHPRRQQETRSVKRRLGKKARKEESEGVTTFSPQAAGYQKNAMRIFAMASPPNVFIGGLPAAMQAGPVPDSPGFPLEACGNNGLRIGK